MGRCMNCVSRVGARLGMVASSVERESQRRVSSYRVVARGASCQGQPRPRTPLPTTSPRRKSDCHRRHKHKAFFNSANGHFWYSSLCFRIFSDSKSKAPSLSDLPPLSPAPSFPPVRFLVFILFSEFFLCAVPLESAGCNYVHVN